MKINQQTLVPVLRINNRRVNQNFLEENLGLRTILEEGAFAEFADTTSKEAQIVLVESPSVRTRAVEGEKKLALITLKAEHPAEIEALLARGASFTRLYRGEKGLAFESLSPEGDRFLLHAEDTVEDLVEILPPETFRALEGFSGLTAVAVENITIRTPHPQDSYDFYQSILPNQTILTFVQAEGADLLAQADSTWDLDSLRFRIAQDANWQELEDLLIAPFFKDKKERFLQTTDPSQIELWFDK